MNLRRLLVPAFIVVVFFTACNSVPAEVGPPVSALPESGDEEKVIQDIVPDSAQLDAQMVTNLEQVNWPDGETRQDEQGQVSVAITPINLGHHDDSIDFEVAMNTHSVDLGIDLAPLATLSTDAGLTVKAITWKAPGGGHHVSGLLSFPTTLGGAHILEDVSQLTLTIQNVDAPERNFTWQLP
jgi:hypothetical protein